MNANRTLWVPAVTKKLLRAALDITFDPRQSSYDGIRPSSLTATISSLLLRGRSPLSCNATKVVERQ
jgi:hypothetical protein